MKITNIREARSQLSKLVEQALAGDEIVIAKAGKPMVRLVPVQESDAPRTGGQWRVKFASPRILTNCRRTLREPSGWMANDVVGPNHRDPFDRMLVVHTSHEGLRSVTCDQEIANYPVPQIMASTVATTRKPCPRIGQRQDSRRLNGVVCCAPAERATVKGEAPWNTCAGITGIRSMRSPVVGGLIERSPATCSGVSCRLDRAR